MKTIFLFLLLTMSALAGSQAVWNVDGTVLSDSNGNLSINAFNGGTNASGTTAWFGDHTWKSVSGGSGTVTSVAGVGTVSGLTLSGTVTTSGTLTLGGAITGFAVSGTNADITTSTALTSIGGANSITVGPSSGASKTLTLQSTTSGGTATTAIVINADQSVSFPANILKSSSYMRIQAGSGQPLLLEGNGGSNQLAINADGTTNIPKLVMGAALRLKVYTVGTLPAGTQGDEAYVTDALAPSFLVTVVAGGSAKTTVVYDGSTWVAQ